MPHSHKNRPSRQKSNHVPSYRTTGVCPTPGKRAYATRKDAKRFLRQYRVAEDLCAYLCPCGVFHVGTPTGFGRDSARQGAVRRLA